MKKKILSLAMLGLLFMVFTSCDFLSTLNAVRGFYQEYQEFSGVYNNATQYTVLTETQLDITNTNIETIVPSDTRVYFMFDQNSEFMYVEQNLEGEQRNSLYQNASDLYIEYMIDDFDVVTPRVPTDEQRFDGNTGANFVNESFSYTDVQNENKTGDRTYEMDVILTKAINLDALGDFLNELKVFDESLAVLNDVVAHLTITFDSVDSTIDVRAVVDSYQITFEDQSTVTFSLTNHTVVKIPENFEMPNVFEDPYQMVAVDDEVYGKQLARRVYVAEEDITYPGTENQSGWVKLDLGTGVYELNVENPDNFLITLYDADEMEIGMSEEGYDLQAGTYYLYITPISDAQVNVTVHQIGGVVITTTTEAVTTVVTTTEAVTTEEITTEEDNTTTLEDTTVIDTTTENTGE